LTQVQPAVPSGADGPFKDGKFALDLEGVPVILCASCSRVGSCRLGVTSEVRDPDGAVLTTLRCPADYEGGPGVAHGGWIAGVLDEITGHVTLLDGTFAVTGEMTVRYLKPVPIERDLTAKAWIVGSEGSRIFVRARLCLASSGAELAHADAVMVARDPEHYARHRAWLAAQDATRTAARAPD